MHTQQAYDETLMNTHIDEIVKIKPPIITGRKTKIDPKKQPHSDNATKRKNNGISDTVYMGYWGSFG